MEICNHAGPYAANILYGSRVVGVAIFPQERQIVSLYLGVSQCSLTYCRRLSLVGRNFLTDPNTAVVKESKSMHMMDE
jgi:hypothetical protein